MQKPVEKAEVALLAGFCYYGDIINNIKRCFWIMKFKISKKEILNYYSIYSLDDSISINDVVIPEARENYEDMVKCSGEYYEYHIALPVLHALCYSCHEEFVLPFSLCFLTNLP